RVPASYWHPVRHSSSASALRGLPCRSYQTSSSACRDPMSPQRNPAWTRDELILALDAYFAIRPRTPSPTLPQVLDLSRELNRIAERSGAARSENYRSPDSVVMKMMNFRSFDENYPGEGLRAAGRADRQVWGDFATDQDRLGGVAQAIRAAYRAT